MGAGRGNARRTSGLVRSPSPATPDSAERLSEKVYLELAAINNWARYADGPDTVVSARSALLQQIDLVGVFSEVAPTWMTSPPPNVEAWVFLPNDVALAMRELTEEQKTGARKGKTWDAINCRAPRRGARRQTVPRNTGHTNISVEEVQELQSLAPERRQGAIVCSKHTVERAMERLGLEEEEAKRLLERVWLEGKILAVPPFWANASQRDAPVFLWHGRVGEKDDELAVSLAANSREELAVGPEKVLAVGTTLLSRAWTEADLLDIDDPGKSVRISTRAAQASTGLDAKLAPAQASAELSQGAPTLDPSPRWVLPHGYYELRAATSDQRLAGVTWNAIRWHNLVSGRPR